MPIQDGKETMTPDDWLAEIGRILDDCLAADDRGAAELVRRFLELMGSAPPEIANLLRGSDKAIDSRYFELPALESLLLSQLGDAIGMCLSISASKDAIATAFDHRTEAEMTFESQSMPVAMTGAIALLAEHGMRSSYGASSPSRFLAN